MSHFWIELIINTLLAIASIFIVSNMFYVMLIYASRKMLNRQKLSWPYNNFEHKPISLIVPSYNEEKNIVDSVESFLAQQYGHFEIIIVNDGSKDQTLDNLLEKYSFKAISFNPEQFKLCQSKILQMFYCKERNITIINKENSGKADALNAGLDIAKYDYTCFVDADSILDPKAFNRVMLEFAIHPSLIACGATIRVVNGVTIRDGKIETVSLPRGYIELCQLLEYTQSFLMGRLGWQFFDATMIISGAFGVFKKAAVKEIGGFDKMSVGEDMDLIVRMHKYYTGKLGDKYSIGFIPDPLCWTEVPSDTSALSNQRNRWQRGLLESIFSGDKILFSTNRSFFSRLAIPFYLITEFVSPFIEILSYILLAIGLIFGFINYKIVILFFIIGLLFSVVISLTSLIYEEKNFSKDMTLAQLLYLFYGSIVMNTGYRQYMAVQRLRGVIDFYLKRKDWGRMDRTGFIHKAPVQNKKSLVEPIKKQA